MKLFCYDVTTCWPSVYVSGQLFYFFMLGHIGHVVKMSVTEYRDRRFEPRHHQHVVSLSKTLSPHCFSRLSYEMSTKREHLRKGSLFSAMSSPEEIALKTSAHCFSSSYD